MWCLFLVMMFQEKSSGRSAHYKLTSTAMLWLQTNKSGSGTMNLGGSLTRQVGKTGSKQGLSQDLEAGWNKDYY